MKVSARRILILILLTAFTAAAGATTFTVTNNSDAGAGSLRDALLAAAANGIGTYDTILFNIPATTTAERTIIINGTLQFSGKLVVDGTSQPGAPFGVTDAKVILKKGTPLMCSGILLDNVTAVEIYGIWFKNFDYFFNLSGDCHGYAIKTYKATHIIIGKLNKGNAFANHHTSTIFNKNYVGNDIFNQTAFADTISIEYNYFGLNDDATAIDPGMLEGIELWNGRNVTVNANNGNCYVVVASAAAEGNGFVTYTNNNFANPINPAQYGFGSLAVSKIGLTNTYARYDVEISNNKVANNNQYCMIFWDLRGNINIENNEVGAYYDMKNDPNDSYGIAMIRCETGSTTRIHNNSIQNRKRGIWLTGCGRVAINNNSIFCNTRGILIQPGPVNIPVVSLNNITPTQVSGTTIPAGRVELFFTNVCTNLCENGKTSLGTTIADAGGAFSFNVTATGLYSAIVTTTDSISSEFNGVKVDTLNATVKNATCGNNNGSITGVIIRNASSWYWENDMNQVISTVDTNLLNLPPGRYRLVLQEANVSCPVITSFFEVGAVPQPVLAGNPFTISQPACGQPNGSINFTGTRPPQSVNSWLDNNGNVLQQNGDILPDLWPGEYYFKLYVWEDTTCFSMYGPFVLSNQSGPTLMLSNAQVINTTCGYANGGISGITAANTTGTSFIQWINVANVVVGSSFDLSNVPAGNYRMKFKDESPCDTIFSNWYTITDNGKITIDTTNKVIRAAGCTVNNGSIANVTVTGATAWQWQNLTTGQPAGNSPDVSNLAAGSYQLTATNGLGCTELSPVIVVGTAIFAAIDVTTVQAADARCGLNNGSITVTGFNANQSLYSFVWMDSTTNQVIALGTAVNGLGQGTYILNATDTNGCQKQIYKRWLQAVPQPAVDVTAIQVTNDNCSLKSGSITGIQITNLAGPANYSWIDQANNIAGTAVNLAAAGAGQYKLNVTDANGCQAASPWITVQNTNSNLSLPDYDNQVVNKNTAVTMAVNNFAQGTYILYRDAASLQELQRNSTGRFTTGNLLKDTIFYIVRIQGSCSSPVAQVRIKVFEMSSVFVPSAFTPNNDSRNDVLKPIAFGAVNLQYFIVFNRYGHIVFRSTNLNNGWDGTIGGKPAEAGTYTWVLRAADAFKNMVIEEKGTVILIR